jgi:hypothetical protein
LHPAITGGLIDRKHCMPQTEAGMASLFYVAGRPSKPVDQEISQALFSTFQILRRVHGFQEVVLGNLAIKRRHQTGENLPGQSLSKPRVRPSLWLRG